MFLFALLALIDGEENKEKFIKLYYKYQDMVMGISMQRLKNNFDLAEENCQEVFTSLAQNFEKVHDVDSKETKSYVANIANSLAINKYRVEILRSPVSVNEEEYFDIADKDSFNDFAATEIKLVIDKLPMEERSYIYLSAVHGYTSKEIGKLYGISDALVRKRLQFIRAKCRKLLSEEKE